jgi:hypothetical protein
MFEIIVHLVLEPLLEVLQRLLLWIAVYLIAFPLACIVLTPVVLLNACFGAGSYIDRVHSGYRGVCAGLLWIGPGGSS